MIRFSKEKVLLLHKILAEATGGSVGIRDEGLLDSALEGVFAGFGDKEFYPSKEEKGARLGYTLISNHAFVSPITSKFFSITFFISMIFLYNIHIKKYTSHLCTYKYVCELLLHYLCLQINHTFIGIQISLYRDIYTLMLLYGNPFTVILYRNLV